MGVAVAVLARTRVMSHGSEDPILASEVEAQLGSSLPLSANGLTEILRVWLFIFLGLPIIWDNSSCGRNTCGARRALFGGGFFFSPSAQQPLLLSRRVLGGWARRSILFLYF